MNEGKSQTYLYYASTLMDKYSGIDYAMKCDADSILHLHDFLKFAHLHLPPKPYNTGVYVGALRDKAYWPKHEEKDMARFESHFGNEYDGVHLYMYVPYVLCIYSLVVNMYMLVGLDYIGLVWIALHCIGLWFLIHSFVTD
jgi:hypothetical protein